VQQVAKITQITFDVDNVPILKVLKFKREEGRVLHPNQLLPADQEETGMLLVLCRNPALFKKSLHLGSIGF